MVNRLIICARKIIAFKVELLLLTRYASDDCISHHYIQRRGSYLANRPSYHIRKLSGDLHCLFPFADLTRIGIDSF